VNTFFSVSLELVDESIEEGEKILQPFFITKKGTEGTGLGLSISFDIVKEHGGNIQTVST
jgi:signal transduction histidine kinase